MVVLKESSHRSLKKILGAVHRLYANRDVQTLPGVMLEVANEITPCDLATFDAINLSTGEVTSLFDRPGNLSPDSFAERWGVLCGEHPVVDHLKKGGQGSVFSVTDFLTAQQFRRLTIYNEIFRALQVKEQLSMILPVPGYVMGLAMNRSRPFHERDRELLTLLQPHLSLAYENALLLSTAQKTAEVDFARWRGHGLTRRESEVLHWIVEGKRDAEIGVILGCRTRTIHTHVSHIFGKLGVETRTAAAAEALKILQSPTRPRFRAAISPTRFVL